jgi:hypothetical protein
VTDAIRTHLLPVTEIMAGICLNHVRQAAEAALIATGCGVGESDLDPVRVTVLITAFHRLEALARELEELAP